MDNGLILFGSMLLLLTSIASGVLGFLYVPQGKIAHDAIVRCEQSIPRDQHCVLQAVREP